MPGNSMLGSTYLSPLKTRVISHNVKTIISPPPQKKVARRLAEAGAFRTQKKAAENEERENGGPRSTEEDKR